MIRIAVLGSTKGTDMEAIADAIRKKVLEGVELSVVISNKGDAGILEKARQNGIEALFISPAGKSREEFDREIDAVLKKNKIELVILIGYMRLLSSWFVNEWRGKIMNVHPSLLPKFAGMTDMNVHKAVLQAKEMETGCTIHFVDESLDGGKIIVQKKVLVEKNDTPETLKAKVQAKEAEAFIEAIRMFQKGELE